MNPTHKAIRARLRAMPVPKAEAILKANLPEREYLAVYLADIMGMNLFIVGERLCCSESSVKKLRNHAYKKLVAAKVL